MPREAHKKAAYAVQRWIVPPNGIHPKEIRPLESRTDAAQADFKQKLLSHEHLAGAVRKSLSRHRIAIVRFRRDKVDQVTKYVLNGLEVDFGCLTCIQQLPQEFEQMLFACIDEHKVTERRMRYQLARKNCRHMDSALTRLGQQSAASATAAVRVPAKAPSSWCFVSEATMIRPCAHVSSSPSVSALRPTNAWR
eukprot:3571566-Prymnesium_polylepis.5